MAGMAGEDSTLYAVLAAVAGLILLRLHLWRAIVFLWPPSIRIEAETPDASVMVPGALEPLWDALRAAGFAPLGSHLEAPRLNKPTLLYDAALESKGVYASVFEGPDGKAKLVLVSRVGDAFAVTANHQRPAREVPGRYLSGGLEGASAERVLKAHLRRLATLGAPEGPFDFEQRLDTARRWLRGPGQAELRMRHAVGFLWAVGALLLLAVAAFGRR